MTTNVGDLGERFLERLRHVDTIAEESVAEEVEDEEVEDKETEDNVVEADDSIGVTQSIDTALDEVIDSASLDVEPESLEEPEDVESEDIEPDESTEEPQETDEIPVFMGEIPPKKKIDYIKWALMHGQSEEELVVAGYNTGTIRNCAFELDKAGYRERATKAGGGSVKALVPVESDEARQKGNLPAKVKVDKELKIFAKGSPAEELIEHFAKLPAGIRDGQGILFESGMKFGLSVAVLGIRMAQELSNLGVSQVKPLIEMTKSMREGEAIAAKSAAREAAAETADQIGGLIGPTLAELKAGMNKKTEVTSGDPMKDMMARTMEPIMKNIMRRAVPGIPGIEELATVTGWTKRKEK